MNNIFILDGQNDNVIGHINKKYVIDNEHEKDLPSHKDYFRFTVLADNKHAEHLTKRNGLIVPGEDDELLEFRIFESIKYRNNEGLFIEVHALATYLDLKNQKIFDPHKTNAETALQHATIALDGTEWQVGQVDFKGIRTLTFDNPFNSYDYILRIAREFELEPRFYIKTDGNKITGRYVDLIERIGEFRGRTIEFGRDLQSIERKEDTSEVVTALWVYGPQREDGTRLKVLVEDDEARQRWGRKGKHIIDYYEPQTENQDITEERLKTLGEMELKKRINAVVTYEAEILDLENVPGLENKKIRFGDTIRIKDTKFNPPLYLEARVFNVKRDVFNKAKKTVQLGDYVEYTEEEVQAIWKQLQQQIQQKISAVQAEQMIEEYAEPKKVESPTPPPIIEGVNPIWVDTSQEPYIPYVADVENNEWVRMTLSDDDVLVNEVNYNGLKWSKDEGLIVERSDGKVRSILNGTDGIKVQQKIGSEWVDVYYVDENGNVKYAGHLEGASGTFSGEITGSIIRGSSFVASYEAGGETPYGYSYFNPEKLYFIETSTIDVGEYNELFRRTDVEASGITVSSGRYGIGEVRAELDVDGLEFDRRLSGGHNPVGYFYVGTATDDYKVHGFIESDYSVIIKAQDFLVTNNAEIRGQLTTAGLTATGQVIIEGGSSGYSYLRPDNPNNELRVANSQGQWSTVRAYTASPSSEKWKSDIKDVDFSAIEVLKQSKIYSYIRDGKKEREIGFVLERETPEILKDGEGINSYTHSSLNTLAIQELIERVENIEERLERLENEGNSV